LRGHQGHEKYNFLKTGRRYYGAIPPVGERHFPKPEPKEGWLLIFVSAEEGSGRLRAVGWYEGAKFEDAPVPRPELCEALFIRSGRRGQAVQIFGFGTLGVSNRR